jgi:hypothetical protein
MKRVQIPVNHLAPSTVLTSQYDYNKTHSKPSDELLEWINNHDDVVLDYAGRDCWLWFRSDQDFIEFKLTWL